MAGTVASPEMADGGELAATEVAAVEVDRDSHVAVTFADGHEARFALGPLRRACPCAECRGRRERGQPVLAASSSPTVADARLVGNWGLGIDWSDGHATGIYAWEVLRAWSEQGLGPASFASDPPAPEPTPAPPEGGFS